MDLNIPQIIQFGFYNFHGLNAVKLIKSGAKTQIVSTPYSNGSVKQNGLSADKKDDLEYEISFLYNSDVDDIHSIQRLMYEGPQIVFFAEKYNKKVYTGKMSSNEVDYRIKYNYAHVIEPITQSNIEARDNGTEFITLSFKIRLMTPYMYEADNDYLVYLTPDKKHLYKKFLYGSFFTTYGGGGQYGDDINETTVKFNSLARKEKKIYMDKIECNEAGLFYYYDVFFYSFEGKPLYGNQPRQRYLEVDFIDNMARNEPLLIDTNVLPSGIADITQGIGLNLMSNATNSVSIVYFLNYSTSGINANAFDQNESISLYNTSTRTGFKFTWLAPREQCPGEIVIRTQVQDGVFDGKGNFLDPYNDYAGKYTLEYMPQSKSTFLLEFRGLYPISEYVQYEQGDILQARHNVASSPTRTNKMIIKNLKTWNS